MGIVGAHVRQDFWTITNTLNIPQIMKHILAHIPANFWAGLVLTTLLLMAAFAARAQGRVIISGNVFATSHTIAPVNVTLEASNGETMDILLARDGAFEIDVPGDDRYMLHFVQMGAISKNVEVDTRNAFRGSGRKHRSIAFDVLLSAADSGDLLRYVDPVGRIAFDETNGQPIVTQKYTLSLPTSVFVAENVE